MLDWSWSLPEDPGPDAEADDAVAPALLEGGTYFPPLAAGVASIQ